MRGRWIRRSGRRFGFGGSAGGGGSDDDPADTVRGGQIGFLYSPLHLPRARSRAGASRGGGTGGYGRHPPQHGVRVRGDGTAQPRLGVLQRGPRHQEVRLEGSVRSHQRQRQCRCPRGCRGGERGCRGGHGPVRRGPGRRPTRWPSRGRSGRLPHPQLRQHPRTYRFDPLQAVRSRRRPQPLRERPAGPTKASGEGSRCGGEDVERHGTDIEEEERRRRRQPRRGRSGRQCGDVRGHRHEVLQRGPPYHQAPIRTESRHGRGSHVRDGMRLRSSR
mmetsp:Transcript_21193/g.61647  ORF Transcript_21193/g.61647 Transcript_21193/m.61647 type:complete len:275 (+) Transcript_21193:402-1226(+)